MSAKLSFFAVLNSCDKQNHAVVGHRHFNVAVHASFIAISDYVA